MTSNIFTYLQTMNAELSAVEVEQAAEAVVDAAICCREARGQDAISPEFRACLIQMVIDDPSCVAMLFDLDHALVH